MRNESNDQNRNAMQCHIIYLFHISFNSCIVLSHLYSTGPLLTCYQTIWIIITLMFYPLNYCFIFEKSKKLD